MEWVKSLKKAISYMEAHLLEDFTVEDIAKEVYISPFYLQKGFKIMTGYSIGEYIRYRRLYLAALDALSGNQKVIELAFRYGYEAPESFTKAFTRFHGISPMQIRNNADKIKTFMPLKIKITISGGNHMDYVVEKMNGFQIIGFEREFSFDSAYQEIPKFWNEFREKLIQPLMGQKEPVDVLQKTICECGVGQFGISIDDIGKDQKFRYFLAGSYQGGTIPEGMKVFTFPDMEWAKFKCVGPMPGALQAVNTRIFQEWIPENDEYEIAMHASVEWYEKGDTSAPDYESAIWFPVKRK